MASFSVTLHDYTQVQVIQVQPVKADLTYFSGQDSRTPIQKVDCLESFSRSADASREVARTSHVYIDFLTIVVNYSSTVNINFRKRCCIFIAVSIQCWYSVLYSAYFNGKYVLKEICNYQFLTPFFKSWLFWLFGFLGHWPKSNVQPIKLNWSQSSRSACWFQVSEKALSVRKNSLYH